MRLLIVISAFTKGGAQRVLLNLIPEWVDMGYKVRLLLMQSSSDELDIGSLHQLNVEIYRLDCKSVFDLKALIKSIKIVWSFTPNIIQSHLYLAQVWSVFLKLLSPKSKLVWVEHNMYLRRTDFEWRVFQFFSRFTFEIISVSMEVMEYLGSRGIKSIRFVPNPISSEFSIRNFEKRDPIVVFVGRFNEQKHPLLAIIAFENALLSRMIPSFAKLVMVGSGSLQKELIEYIAERKLESQIEFKGFIDSKSLSDLFNVSSILISTSRHEGCPLVRSEAIASGCCIVTTKTGGLRGILTEDREGRFLFPGVFVVADSPSALSKSLADALKDEYWTRSSLVLRASVAKTFHPKEIAKLYVGKYVPH